MSAERLRATLRLHCSGEGDAGAEPSLSRRRCHGRAERAFVGIDVAKLRNAVAVTDGGRMGEARYLGEFDADKASMRCLGHHA
ncbi:hypothetical protein E5554_03520 [Sphingobium sp. PAMC28499]|jgi:hypothetical protein|uniref:IS110 family transposase n=1 Tax=Staphylococcus haemolyticus TaxID=1283 RepID=A0A7Z1N8K6_STAHA|nr:hypothetical protein CV019_00410 [Staphylococcus haemolyticus]QCB36980.1 hypothetical protein E5554_03520 [Sphingobium sp. PAMC28499]RSU76144.1 hypothetical protein BRX37_08950 [Sphingomonas sp. S-NIH.Pt3_0716]